MTAIHERQYRHISSIETSAMDALSVRTIQDMANNVNNLARHCLNGPIFTDAWPQTGTAVTDKTSVYHTQGSTADYSLLLYLGKFYIPSQYNKLNIMMISRMPMETPTAFVTKFYAATNLYAHYSTPFDADYLQLSTNVSTNTDSNSWDKKEIQLSIPYRNELGEVYLYLTAACSNENDVGTICSITMQPTIA